MPYLIRSLNDFPNEFRGGAVAIGNFDGVHRGHALLVRALVELARQIHGPAVVFTFDPPPIAVLQPDRPLSAPLTDIQRRAELLKKLGVDLVVAYPTDDALLNLTATDFFNKVMIETLGAEAIVEGPNFRFGHQRHGDTRLLGELCHGAGISLTIVPAANDDAGMVSSTRIRELINEGSIARANELLTQPFQISGQVGYGAGRGRTIGTPTANLTGIKVLVPPHGVYAGCVAFGDSQCAAAVHIGPNPTFQDENTKVEVHLIDWSGELYDSKLDCIFLERLRNVQRFESPAKLQSQIASDIGRCREIFAKYAAADQ